MLRFVPFRYNRGIVDKWLLIAPAHDWISVYDEGHLILEVEKVPRNVRPGGIAGFDAWLISFSSPGFFSRLKEKGTLAKDAWGVIGSAYVLIKSPDNRANLPT